MCYVKRQCDILFTPCFFPACSVPLYIIAADRLPWPETVLFIPVTTPVCGSTGYRLPDKSNSDYYYITATSFITADVLYRHSLAEGKNILLWRFPINLSTHSVKDIPIIIHGPSQGIIRMNNFSNVKINRRSHYKLIVTINPKPEDRRFNNGYAHNACDVPSCKSTISII